MKIAYLILAHHYIDHLSLLITRLAHPNVSFIIHLDSKSSVSFLDANNKIYKNDNVYFIKNRTNINWGGFSMFEAIFNLLRVAIKHNCYDYIYLISGQDFPLKRNDYILSFLSQNKGQEFIEYHKLPYLDWPGNGGKERYNYFWLIDEIGLKESRKFVEDQKILGQIRKFPNGLEPYGGSMWFTITTACAKYFIDFLTNHPDILLFFKYAMISDELILPTVILNSHFRGNIINNNLRYIKWAKGNIHPDTLTMSDLVEIKKSNCHFARKFDPEVDENIVIEISKHSTKGT